MVIMKKMKHTLSILAIALSFIASAQQVPASKQETFTIMNATAHIGNGTVIPNSVIVIENGIITTIADATVVRIAPKGQVINASGKHAYPGIIGMNTTLGLVEIDAVSASDDEREIGTFNPHVRSIIAYNAESRVVETMRPNGVLMVQVVPRGGRISGSSSVVQMDAWNWEDAAVRLDNGIHLNWPASFSRTGSWYEPGPMEVSKNYDKQVAELQDFMTRAVAYNTTKSPKTDLKFAAMKNALAGNVAFYFHVNGEKSIRDVLNFIAKNSITKAVIVGGSGAQNCTKELVAAKVAVLAGRVHELPAREDEDYDMPYKLPKLLADAGVLVALENSGDMERHQARNFPFYAGTVAAHGLDKEKALEMITLSAAKILGIDKNYGSLEQGKSATLFISEGDALDMRTNKLTHAFIDGKKLNLNTRQKDLYERYQEKYKN
jgi:imidazolonepropionase-like amidohydrolase